MINSARYIVRLDDITPTMRRATFWSVMDTLLRNGIKPLLGVVPDNQDEHLNYESPMQDFWQIMREFKSKDLADIAQHGFQHTLTPRNKPSLLGPVHRLRNQSEFVGDSFEVQATRIAAGKRVLSQEGLETTFWMAPSHSFDRNTLRALRASGFTALSDGLALFPFRYRDLIFIPQQIWRPRPIPLGVITLCLHTNNISADEIRALRALVRGPAQFSSFSREVEVFHRNFLHSVADVSFGLYYRAKRYTQTRPGHSFQALPLQAFESRPQP
jgi:predicted deacetylase